jgi:hypothetical protein
MKAKRAAIALCLTGVGVAIVSVGASLTMPTASPSKARTINVVLRFTDANARLDLGERGSTTGDTVTFSGPMLDSRDRRIGFGQGHCVMTLPTRPLAQCFVTFFFPRGQISTQGPNYFNRAFNEGITGGTGEFRSARGEVRAAPLPGGDGLRLRFQVLR